MIHIHYFSLSDVRVRFDPELYSVSESSGSVSVRVVLLGETSNTVAVTLRTLDQEAMGIFIPQSLTQNLYVYHQTLTIHCTIVLQSFLALNFSL